MTFHTRSSLAKLSNNQIPFLIKIRYCIRPNYKKPIYGYLNTFVHKYIFCLFYTSEVKKIAITIECNMKPNVINLLLCSSKTIIGSTWRLHPVLAHISYKIPVRFYLLILLKNLIFITYKNTAIDHSGN